MKPRGRWVRITNIFLFMEIEEIVEDYDVDVRNIDNSVVDIRNNVVDKCCKQSKT